MNISKISYVNNYQSQNLKTNTPTAFRKNYQYNTDTFSLNGNEVGNEISFKSKTVLSPVSGGINELLSMYSGLRNIRTKESKASAKLEKEFKGRIKVLDKNIRSFCSHNVDFLKKLFPITENEERFIGKYRMQDAEEGKSLQQTLSTLENILYNSRLQRVLKAPDEVLRLLDNPQEPIKDDNTIQLIKLCKKKVNLEIMQPFKTKALSSEYNDQYYKANNDVQAKEQELIGSSSLVERIKYLCKNSPEIYHRWDAEYQRLYNEEFLPYATDKIAQRSYGCTEVERERITTQELKKAQAEAKVEADDIIYTQLTGEPPQF